MPTKEIQLTQSSAWDLEDVEVYGGFVEWIEDRPQESITTLADVQCPCDFQFTWIALSGIQTLTLTYEELV
ncbi:MAG: hypothetical protein F6K50_02620 [Moorea sp. SIO3I7]|nr:hypothetical protein [Moorena sp. SIO3I7]